MNFIMILVVCMPFFISILTLTLLPIPHYNREQ